MAKQVCLCLEDYLLQESCTWDDRSVSLKHRHCKLQSNLNGSNTDDLFTVDDSN